MSNKAKKISVRLDEKSANRLDEAIAKGYTTSQFVNASIKGLGTVDISLIRKMMVHVNNLQSQVEFEDNPKVKSYMREELNQICLSLRSFLSPT